MILSSANSLFEDIQAARTAGFVEDFRYAEHKLIVRGGGKSYGAEDCVLIEYCRHEGMNDPSDSSILFLIECADGTKGCLSSAYGPDADTELIEFVRSLKRADI